MDRFLLDKLIEWKNCEVRKPVILSGGRRVGKTHLVKDVFSKTFLKCAYIDCRYDQALLDKGVSEQVRFESLIEEHVGVGFEPEKDLLIIDNVPDFTSLASACQALSFSFVVLIGSGGNSRFDVEFEPCELITLRPLSFSEFIDACRVSKETLTHQQQTEYLSYYIAVGGLPEAVNAWLSSNDCDVRAERVIDAHKMIVDRIEDDGYWIDTELLLSLIGNKYDSDEVISEIEEMTKSLVLNRARRSQSKVKGSDAEFTEWHLSYDIGLLNFYVPHTLSINALRICVLNFVVQELLAYGVSDIYLEPSERNSCKAVATRTDGEKVKLKPIVNSIGLSDVMLNVQTALSERSRQISLYEIELVLM